MTFEPVYNDEGGAGASTDYAKTSPRNPLTSCHKPPAGKPKAKSVEEEKIQVLKELSAKDGTHQTPIIINPPTMSSPTPSVISASMCADEEEDDLNIWGCLIIRKLRKFKDQKMQEDVQSFIHVLVTDAERGECRKPPSLTVNPNLPLTFENKTPERFPQVTHIFRSPRVNSNQLDQSKPTQTAMGQDSGEKQGAMNVPQRINQPNAGVAHEEMSSSFSGVAHQQISTTTGRNSNPEKR